jgi:hypothetical protein
MSRHVVWLAGRGVSMSCGLDWNVPSGLEAALRRRELSRVQLKARICDELSRAQDDASIDCGPLDTLLARARASDGWRHALLTTNWDELLDRTAARYGFEPPLHLNGSVGGRNILLEDDDDRAREAVPQAREGLRRLLEADVVVAAGLSLASGLDKALLSRLAGKRGGHWLVVNRDAAEVRRACEELRRRLPGCSVQAAELPFDEWVCAGFPGLKLADERAA